MKILTREYNVIDCDDLERYVQELYGFNPDIEALEEWYNANYIFDVDGELNKWELDDWLEALEDNGRVSCRVCLNKLCADGWLPTGSYLVRVMS